MKSYSSGMGARLRFAIAAAVDPEILLVDEALNTGDAQFKDRSKKRMEQVTSQAGTVFIVSHSLGTITEMCNRAIWIDKVHYGWNTPRSGAGVQELHLADERGQRRLWPEDPRRTDGELARNADDAPAQRVEAVPVSHGISRQTAYWRRALWHARQGGMTQVKSYLHCSGAERDEASLAGVRGAEGACAAGTWPSPYF